MELILIAFIKIVVVLLVILTTVANLVYAERKISASIQNRIGPNRVGPWGLLQAPADVLKLFMKEDIVPASANAFVHTLAPVISLTVAMTTFAVIPFGDTITLFGREIKLQIADVNIGVLYILAMTSMGVYGVTLSGWASNNKYSLLGGLRSAAQMISYELSMGLSVVGVIMVAGTLQLDKVVAMRLCLERIPDADWVHYICRCLVCRDKPPSLRSSGSGARARRGLPHGVFRHEIRDLFSRRICEHDHIERPHRDVVSRRLAGAVSGALWTLASVDEHRADRLIRAENMRCDLLLYVGSLDHPTVPL
jgi:hypothetical protein